MADFDLIKEFLNRLEPDDVPLDYISSACIKSPDGQDLVLKGVQLKLLMSNDPTYSFVKDAKIYINLGKVVKSINLEVEYVYEQVEKKFLAEGKHPDITE